MVHSAAFYNLYQRTYETYRDLYGKLVCVFLQKGSFFEIYGQQSPVTQEHLNTGKHILELLELVTNVYPNDAPNGNTGFYGGVPVEHIDKWATKLTSKGWTVVILQEVKNAAGTAVTERKVTQVLSAGTHTKSAEFGRVFCTSSLWLQQSPFGEPPLFGVATADLTTGQVYLYEGKATGKADCWHTDDLRHFFQVYPPKELVLSVKGSISQLDEESLRRTLHIPSAPLHIRTVQDTNIENAVVREEYLRSMFQPKTALPLRTWLRCPQDGSSLQELALTCLLRFAEDHSTALAQQLQAPCLWHPKQNLQIINNALTQLNLLKSTQDQLCVEDLFVEPLTAMGKRSLTARLCNPLADAEAIQTRHAEVQWILDHKDSKDYKHIEGCLGLMYDIGRIHRSVIRGTFGAADCVQLFQSYTSAQNLWTLLEQYNSPFQMPSSIGADIGTCLTEFNTLFDVQKAQKALQSLDELGFLLEGVGPKTAAMEAKISETYAQANAWLASFCERTGVNKDSAYFRPTDKTMFTVHTTKTTLKAIEAALKKQPDLLQGDYKGLHLKTLTSAARVEHPTLDKLQEQLDSHKAALSRCLKQEGQQACIRFAEATRALWQGIEEWVTHVDLSLTMAKTAHKQGWIQPTVLPLEEGQASSVEIEHLRHPLIEVQKRQSKYVTHTVSLGTASSQGWLLYGMNASGKSSLMKAVGLAVLLAQVGSYVPATAMTVRPFHRIATRILNQDNLWAGLSSFAVEMSELREILSVADQHTLVLGDELCAGTESISGTAIVAAGIQHLHKAGTRFVLATHLHDLMKLPQITTLPSLDIFHLHVEYDPVTDVLVYHRILRPGPGSSMYGLEVAKALHLPSEMIESAFALRRALLDEATVETASKSSWNANLTRRMCSACNTRAASTLEVHHLQERAAAINGRNSDGTALNHLRNLVVLCEECHDKHHANALHIGPIVDTSQGPQRQVVETPPSPSSPSTPAKRTVVKFSKETLETVAAMRKEHPALHPRLLVFKLQQDAELEITEAQLKALIKKGLV